MIETTEGSQFDSLEWQAWCYVSGEMIESERVAFEATFSNLAVCEAVARQAKLFAGLEQASESPMRVAAGAAQASTWMSRGLMVAAACLLWGCLSLGFFGLRNGTNRQVRLGEIWVGTQQDEIVDGDFLVAAVESNSAVSNSAVDETFDLFEVPEWMTVGVQDEVESTE